jgi:hypothetical protein
MQWILLGNDMAILNVETWDTSWNVTNFVRFEISQQLLWKSLFSLIWSYVILYACVLELMCCVLPWCVFCCLFCSCSCSGTRHREKHTAGKNATHILQHTSTSKGPAYILKTEDSSFLNKKILTPDDGHIGRNMWWTFKLLKLIRFVACKTVNNKRYHLSWLRFFVVFLSPSRQLLV